MIQKRKCCFYVEKNILKNSGADYKTACAIRFFITIEWKVQFSFFLPEEINERDLHFFLLFV